MKLSDAALAQYRAVLDSAGLVDCAGRGKVRATGPDRVGFLHAMISNDVQQLAEYAGRYATLLTAQGRIVADFYLYKLPDEVLIDLDGGLAETLVTTLEKFVIMDDVTLEDVTSRWGHLSLQGPSAPKVLGRVTGLEPPPEELQVRSFACGGENCLAVRKGYLHPVGLDVLGPPAAVAELKILLLGDGGVPEVGEQAAEVLRVERGIPRYGADMDDTHYPMEARLDHAISLTKGCYIGQEVVAKATNIGGVNRLLCRLEMQDDQLPPPSATVLAEGRKIGAVTSAVRSPRAPRPIALAYLRRAFTAPGTGVSLGLEGGEARAEVVERFRLS